MNLGKLWYKESIPENFNAFFQEPILKTFCSLPQLVVWADGLPEMFDSSMIRLSLLFKFSTGSWGLLPHYLCSSTAKEPRVLSSLEIDQIKVWGFFDGACQGPNHLCGDGFQMNFSNEY